MKKPFYSIVTNKGDANARINIYGVIGRDYWGDGEYIEGKKFVKDLADLERKFERIDIHINSPGGSINEGLPIYNAIRSSEKEIHTYVDGIAYSMGAMIALAGHTVHAAKGSLLMLHNASGSSWGNAKALRKSADMLDTYDEVLGQLIADKTGKTPEEVKALWLNMEDNFLTATAAHKERLVDVLETYDADDIADNAQNLTIHQVAAYFLEQSEEPTPTLMGKIISGVTAHFSTNPKSTDMKFPKIEALANVENPTNEQLEQANADLSTAGVTKASLVSEDVLNAAQQVTVERDELKVTNQTLTISLSEKTKAFDDLQAKFNALGDNAGASHIKPVGEGVQPEATEGDDVISNLAHNKAAESYLSNY
jgi:ATP-dependent Clp protease protease subunit